jgi:hypothetical protein
MLSIVSFVGFAILAGVPTRVLKIESTDISLFFTSLVESKSFSLSTSFKAFTNASTCFLFVII